MQKEIWFYETTTGKKPFETWFSDLKDNFGKGIILKRLKRVKVGNYGKCRNLGQIKELKITVGPGYRIYFGERGKEIVVLLTGGDKSTQSKDIKKAVEYWKDYIKREIT